MIFLRVAIGGARFFSENRYPPWIKSGAGFFGITLQGDAAWGVGKMKIAYFGSDLSHECMRLLASDHQVIALFTFRTDNVWVFNTKVIREAERVNAPIYFGAPTADHIERLAAENCELLVSAGYRFRIPIVGAANAPKIKGINVHPSLLPVGRGPWPQPWIILRHPEAAGVTIHKLNAQWDAGDILVQEKVAVTDADDLETLSFKLRRVAPRLLTKTIAGLSALWQSARPQGEGSYWRRPTYEERRIDWSKPVDDIRRLARAFSKFETGAILDGKRWVVTRLNGWVETHDYAPGTVVDATQREMLVAARDGFICLQEFRQVMRQAKYG